MAAEKPYPFGKLHALLDDVAKVGKGVQDERVALLNIAWALRNDPHAYRDTLADRIENVCESLRTLTGS